MFFFSSNIPVKHTDLERYRAGQLQAERMLEARELSHRQQIHRLENQVTYYYLKNLNKDIISIKVLLIRSLC